MKIKNIVLIITAILLILFFKQITETVTVNAQLFQTGMRKDDEANNSVLNVGTGENLIKSSAQLNIPEKCLGLPGGLEISEQWQRDKKQDIKQHMLKLSASGVSSAILDEIFVRSGIQLANGRSYLQASERTDLGHLLPNSTQASLSGRELLLLQALADTHDIKGIVSAYQNSQLAANKWVHHNAQFYSPISLVIKLMVTESQPLDESELTLMIERLLQAEVAVKFVDLVTATAENLPTGIVDLLVNHFHQDLNQAFLYQTQLHTLVTLSVSRQSLSLTKYWLALKVKGRAIEQKESALDILAGLDDGGDYHNYQQLFLSLAASGVTVNNPKTIAALSNKLSADLLNKYRQQLTAQAGSYFTAEETRIIEDNISSLSQLVLNDSFQIGLTLSENTACNDSLGRALIQRLYKQERWAKINEKKAKVKPFLTEAQLKDELNALQQQSLSEEEIIAALGRNKDRSAKDAVAKYLLEQARLAREQWEKNKRKKRKSHITQEQRERFHEQIKAGDWQQAMAEAQQQDGVEMEPQKELDAALTYSLVIGAELNVLLDLVERGAMLDVTMMTSVIKKGEPAFVDALYRHGYDFHYVNFLGENSVTEAVQHNKLQILTYLINKGVSVKPMPYGEDPLDNALYKLKSSPYDLSYVNALINAGAPIEPSHKEVVQSFILSENELYRRLINKHPQLEM